MGLIYCKDGPPIALEVHAMQMFLDRRRRKVPKPEAWAVYQMGGYTKFVDILGAPKPGTENPAAFHWDEIRL